MRRTSYLAALLLFAVLSMARADAAFAQTWPALTSPPQVTQTGANDVAVIVAIEDYAFLPDIPNAARNAAEWETFLRRGLGVANVLTLTNQEAVREQILDFAARASDAATETSTVWFIFVGHGGPAPNGEDGLLIGADGQQNVASMAARGVLQQELLDVLQRGAQQRTVVLLDACFSGRTPSGEALATGTMPVLVVTSDPTLAPTTVVMTAASSDQFAGDLPEVARPAFSYLVLGALRGWGDDGDGVVTATEATAFARRELMTIPGRTQTPQLAGDGSFALSIGATEPRPTTSSAFAQTSVDARQTDTAPQLSQPDGKADSTLFAHIHAGVLFSAMATNIGYGAGVAGGIGAKLGEFRLGGFVLVGNPADPTIPTSGTLPTDDGGVSEARGKRNAVTALGGLAALSIGYGFRSESNYRADNVLAIEALSGLSHGSTCSRYEVSVAGGRPIKCNGSTRGRVGAFFGGRVGANYGIFSASLVAGFRTVGPTIDPIATLGVGVALDD